MVEIKGEQILYTKPFEPVIDNAHSHIFEYKNETDKTIRIYKVQIWMGMDIGGRGDYWFTLARKSDNNILGITNWDHYAEPTGAMSNTYTQDFTPNYIDLTPGDSLVLTCGLRLWFWSLSNFAVMLHLYDVRGDMSITIWYEEI